MLRLVSKRPPKVLVLEGRHKILGETSVLETLHRDADSIVERVSIDGRQLVRKRPSTPSESAQERYRRATAAAVALETTGVVSRHELEMTTEGPVLHIASPTGRPLHDVLNTRLTIPERLRLLIGIAAAVQRFHSRHLAHGSLDGRHVLVHDKTNEIELIGLTSVTPSISSIELDGEARSDAHGEPPSTAADLRAIGSLVEASFEPDLTFTQRSGGDGDLGGTDLLADVRAVRDRLVGFGLPYRSAAAAERDLRQLLKSYEQTGRPSLPADQLRGFDAESPLVGRDAETSELRRALTDQDRLVAMTGDGGVGKTALVDWLAAFAGAQGTLVARATCSKSGPTEPYAEVATVCGVLAAERLAAPRVEYERWITALNERPQLREALCQLVPTLGERLGGRDRVFEPVDRSSLTSALEVLMNLTLAAGRRVLIIIDNAHWLDDDSTQILSATLRSGTDVQVVLVGRSLDLDRLEALQPQSIDGCYRMTVAPLDVVGVSQLIASTLQDENVDPSIADLVHDLTAGFPLHVRQLIQRSLENRIVAYDPLSHAWAWRADDLASLDVAPNVADLIAQSVRLLSPTHRKVLAAAACSGHPFTIEASAAAADTTPDLAAEAIWAGVERRIIRRSGGLTHTATYLSLDMEYDFVHDRVADAALSMIDHSEQATARLRLGWHHAGRDELTMAGLQLAAGGSSVADANDRMEVATKLQEAAEFARASASFVMARTFFEAGISLLDRVAGQKTDVAAKDRLDLTLRLGAAEAAFFQADYDRMTELLDMVEASTDDPAVQLRAATYRCRAHYSRQEVEKAVEVGLAALALAGHELPTRAVKARTATALIGLRRRLRSYSDADLLQLPTCTNHETVELHHLLHELFTSLYGVRPELLPLVAAKGVDLTLRHGLSPFSPVAFALYGLLHTFVGDHDRSSRFGRLAIILADRDQFLRTRPRVHFLYYNFIHHWHEPVESALDTLAQSFDEAVANGDLDFAGVLAVVEVSQMHVAGHRLPTIAARAESAVELFPDNDNAAALCRVMNQYFHNLMGRAPEPYVLAGNGAYDEREVRPRAEKDGDTVALSTLLLCQLAVRFWGGDYRGAVGSAEELQQYVEATSGTTNVPNAQMHHFFSACKAHPKARATRSLARTTLKNFDRWAKRAPGNWGAQAHVLHAAWARARGHLADAERRFEKALSVAQQYGQPQWAALAQEQLGELCMETDRRSMAEHYLSSALDIYIDLGLQLRVDLLEERYGAREYQSGGRATDPIDLQAALEAMTGAEDGHDLIGSFLTALERSTSADAVFLLLDTDGEETTRAVKYQGRPPQLIFDAQQQVGGIASAARIVSRTRQPLLVEDVRTTVFANEPEVRSRSIRSLLIVPLLANDRVIGQFQLEHHSRSHAFSTVDQASAEIMAAQLALSLENLQLTGQLERLSQREAGLVDASRRFVPDEVLDWLGHKSLEAVRLGDSIVREMTVMFSDIRSFTTMAERQGPLETSQLEIDFFRTVEPAIVSNHGVIQSFRGDEILAVFHRSPDDAIRAGLAMVAAQRRWRDQTTAPVRAGIGINTGLISVSAVGGVQRLSTTVSGDAVNLASRIEGLTRRYGSDLLIGETTFKALGDASSRADLRRVERVRVANRSGAVTVYEVFGGDQPEERKAKRANEELAERAFAAFDGGDIELAHQLFSQWRADLPFDRVPRLHLERLEAATAGEWDPVTSLDTK